MPWNEVTTMSLREEFTNLAKSGAISITQLCRRFSISRKTGYKWLKRRASGEGLDDKNRRPHCFRCQTSKEVEQEVVRLRLQYPFWGGRKINKILGDTAPAPSTITGILHRNGLINPSQSSAREHYLRFEREHPNDLWQLDFKGHFAMTCGRCYPLTMVDDNSRYGLCLKACPDERFSSVKPALEDCFRRYGLPQAMAMDNGSPWGGGRYREITKFGVWIMQLGITIIHGRPGHPQTRGKNERFNKTLGLEAISAKVFSGLEQVQRHFDQWLNVYNTKRPHEALDLATPVERYRPSRRQYPETLPEVEYEEGAVVRKVHECGVIGFNGKRYRVGKGLAGQLVKLAEKEDGEYSVEFCGQMIRMLNLRQEEEEE